MIKLLLFFTCLTKILGKDCDGCKAYKCFEDKAECGKDGYLLKYGYKYCNRFNGKDIFQMYDKIGQNFISCTGKCLIDYLDEYLKTHKETNCDNLRKSAFESHVECYVKCNFCEACVTNKWALLHTYDWRDFFDILSIKQVIETLYKCGGFLPCFTSVQLASVIIGFVIVLVFYKVVR